MFRKALLALSALAVIGAAAFVISVPTTASANSWHNQRNHHNWRPAVRFSAPYYGSCFVRRVVPTPFGPRVTHVNVCG